MPEDGYGRCGGNFVRVKTHCLLIFGYKESLGSHGSRKETYEQDNDRKQNSSFS
jgi:hypothetical protein